MFGLNIEFGTHFVILLLFSASFSFHFIYKYITYVLLVLGLIFEYKNGSTLNTSANNCVPKNSNFSSRLLYLR